LIFILINFDFLKKFDKIIKNQKSRKIKNKKSKKRLLVALTQKHIKVLFFNKLNLTKQKFAKI